MGSKQQNWLCGGLSHPSQSRWMQCLAQSQFGAARKAPINSSADAAACGGSVRKPLCCCNVLPVALCTLQTALASRHCSPGSSCRVSPGCFIPATATLHCSELAPNAGPGVTIYCWICCLRRGHKANKDHQKFHCQGLGMLLLVVPITSTKG